MTQHQEDRLKIVNWAMNGGLDNEVQILTVQNKPLALKMSHSNATGEGLVSNGEIGADLIRLEAGQGFQPHTHPGDHLLIVIAGKGTITYDGHVYPTEAGQIYMIDGKIPHGVGAITDHVIMAVGSPHKAVDDPERMMPVEYQHVLAQLGTMTCLICEMTAEHPQTLKEMGCPHCPTQYKEIS